MRAAWGQFVAAISNDKVEVRGSFLSVQLSISKRMMGPGPRERRTHFSRKTERFQPPHNHAPTAAAQRHRGPNKRLEVFPALGA